MNLRYRRQRFLLFADMEERRGRPCHTPRQKRFHVPLPSVLLKVFKSFSLTHI